MKLDEPAYSEADFAPGTGPLPPGAEDGFDPNIFLDFISGNVVYKTPEQRQATMIAPGSGAQTGPIRVYTDGSSLGNGKTGALAGVGVYFGPSDKRQAFKSPLFTQTCNHNKHTLANQLTPDASYQQEHIRPPPRPPPNEPTRRTHRHLTSPRPPPPQPRRRHRLRQQIRHRLLHILVPQLAPQRLEDLGGENGRE